MHLRTDEKTVLMNEYKNTDPINLAILNVKYMLNLCFRITLLQIQLCFLLIYLK